eukprot:jgi/Mesen1/2178/ME000152S01267
MANSKSRRRWNLDELLADLAFDGEQGEAATCPQVSGQDAGGGKRDLDDSVNRSKELLASSCHTSIPESESEHEGDPDGAPPSATAAAGGAGEEGDGGARGSPARQGGDVEGREGAEGEGRGGAGSRGAAAPSVLPRPTHKRPARVAVHSFSAPLGGSLGGDPAMPGEDAGPGLLTGNGGQLKRLTSAFPGLASADTIPQWPSFDRSPSARVPNTGWNNSFADDSRLRERTTNLARPSPQTQQQQQQLQEQEDLRLQGLFTHATLYESDVPPLSSPMATAAAASKSSRGTPARRPWLPSLSLLSLSSSSSSSKAPLPRRRSLDLPPHRAPDMRRTHSLTACNDDDDDEDGDNESDLGASTDDAAAAGSPARSGRAGPCPPGRSRRRRERSASAGAGGGGSGPEPSSKLSLSYIRSLAFLPAPFSPRKSPSVSASSPLAGGPRARPSGLSKKSASAVGTAASSLSSSLALTPLARPMSPTLRLLGGLRQHLSSSLQGRSPLSSPRLRGSAAPAGAGAGGAAAAAPAPALAHLLVPSAKRVVFISPETGAGIFPPPEPTPSREGEDDDEGGRWPPAGGCFPSLPAVSSKSAAKARRQVALANQAKLRRLLNAISRVNQVYFLQPVRARASQSQPRVNSGSAPC